MWTIVQAADFPETSDANRAFAGLKAGSAGEMHVTSGSLETFEALMGEGKRIAGDTRLWDPQFILPTLRTSKGEIPLRASIDTRLRTLASQVREEDVIRIITPMAVSKENAFFEVLAMWKQLEDKTWPWQWYILGRPDGDEDFDRWTEELEDLGLADNVTLVGEYTLERYIKLSMNMDFALFPAAGISLDLTLLEALQLGLPIISPRSDHLSTAMIESESIFVVQDWNGDAAKVVDFISRVRGAADTERFERDLSGFETWRNQAREIMDALGS